LTTVPLEKSHGHSGEQHSSHGENTSKYLGRNICTRHANEACALEVQDEATSGNITVGVVSIQPLLALAGRLIQVGADFGDLIGVLLIVVVLVIDFLGFLAGDAAGVDDGFLGVGEGVAIVQGLVDAVGGRVATGFLHEDTQVDLLSVVGAVCFVVVKAVLDFNELTVCQMDMQ